MKNREIKFRAWDESQKYMAYQGTPDLETIQSFMFHYGEKILMQYIGLKDFNGKKIYEGDIILVNGKYHKIVKYHEKGFSFCLINICDLKNKNCMDIEQIPNPSWFSDFNRKIEVIGNIYETPELLEKPWSQKYSEK
jgi:uncharacterized phage protein (TIGR01671 family)